MNDPQEQNYSPAAQRALDTTMSGGDKKKVIELAYGKIDDARTQIGIIRIAGSVGDKAKQSQAIDKADALLFEAFCELDKIL